METQYKKLILRGKAIVFIDWANVYGWEKTLKRSINPKKLYDYLKTYAEVIDIRFYFGDDDHPKSKKLLIELGKQVIVAYTPGHLGREIQAMKKGIFKVELENLMDL